VDIARETPEEKVCEEKIEEIVNNLLIKIFPWLSYKVPRPSYSIQPEDIPKNLPAKKAPKKLTETHFAILSYLRLYTEREETIRQKELYEKLDWEALSKKKFNRKVAELKNLRLLADHKDSPDRRIAHLSITEKGLKVLSKAETKRKEFLVDSLRGINLSKARVLVGILEILSKT